MAHKGLLYTRPDGRGWNTAVRLAENIIHDLQNWAAGWSTGICCWTRRAGRGTRGDGRSDIVHSTGYGECLQSRRTTPSRFLAVHQARRQAHRVHLEQRDFVATAAVNPDGA